MAEINLPRKVAIYIRVSTTYQIDKDSLPMQRKDLTAYSELVLGIKDYEIFEDAGYSGKNTARPGFQDMMRRIRQKEFSHVLVWKIDRISRNLLDFSKMYAELKELGVTFVSKNEQFDTSTAMGEAMLKIILVFAELERNMTSERVTATMISRANSGEWNGGLVPYGYSYDSETGKFSIVESEAEICRLIRDVYIKNKSIIYTVRYLSANNIKNRSGKNFTQTGVHHILSNPFYCGTYRYNKVKADRHRLNPESEWVVIPDHHPAIFSQDDYDTILAIRKANDNMKHSPGRPHKGKVRVFSRLIYCGKCGSNFVTYVGHQMKAGFFSGAYICSKRKNSRSCSNPAVSDVRIGEFVLNYIRNMLNAQKDFEEISGLDDLQSRLLSGRAFSTVKSISPDSLQEFWSLLENYHAGPVHDLFTKSARKSHEKCTNTASLRKERNKQERALLRLQDLYLYSEQSMSEKDFIIRKQSITSRIEEIDRKLESIEKPVDDQSDEEFIRQASSLLISKYLNSRDYILYKDIASNVSDEVLHAYIVSVIERIYVDDSKVISILFKNGLMHRFFY